MPDSARALIEPALAASTGKLTDQAPDGAAAGSRVYQSLTYSPAASGRVD